MKAKDTDKLPRIAFLLGAGASLPAGMPKTCKITEQVLSISNIGRHQNGCYYMNDNSGLSEHYLKRVRVMLDLVKNEVGRFYSQRQPDGSGPFNYEDLYYVARQIKDYADKAQDNPAILPFIDKISPAIEPCLDCAEDETIIEKWTLANISWETANYIRDVVRGMLSKEPAELNYLSFIGEAWKACKSIDIFTLNHDRVIERYLEKEHIPFTDGFGTKKEGGVRLWDPSLFESGDGQARLFKLHGGVDWFSFRPQDSTTPLDNKIAIKDGSPWTAEGLTPQGGHPEILIGTYNKLIDYAGEVFIDLRHMFYQSLLSAHHVIICGYSFGDHGINKMLDTWIKLPDRRLVVVDPEAETFKQRKSKWFESRVLECWDELKSRGILKCIPKRIENVRWEEMKDI